MNLNYLHTTGPRRWYDFSELTNPYHNWQHASDVADVIWAMPCAPEEKLIIAAYWHDAVYVPGAGGDANEQCSAAALINTAQYLKNTDEWKIIEDAAELIRYTSIEYHLWDKQLGGDIAKLLDADLHGLACEYDAFVYKQDNIIIEQHGNIDTDRSKCAAFLENFLDCREFIYHTDFGRSLYENTAKENIKRYCEEHG